MINEYFTSIYTKNAIFVLKREIYTFQETFK